MNHKLRYKKNKYLSNPAAKISQICLVGRFLQNLNKDSLILNQIRRGAKQFYILELRAPKSWLKQDPFEILTGKPFKN